MMTGSHTWAAGTRRKNGSLSFKWCSEAFYSGWLWSPCGETMRSANIALAIVALLLTTSRVILFSSYCQQNRCLFNLYLSCQVLCVATVLTPTELPVFCFPSLCFFGCVFPQHLAVLTQHVCFPGSPFLCLPGLFWAAQRCACHFNVKLSSEVNRVLRGLRTSCR